MQVREIMTTPVVSIAPETPFKEVVERLVESQVSGLPVVDGGGRLIGIVTESDLVTKEAYPDRRRTLAFIADLLSERENDWLEKAAGRTAHDVMTRNVATCGPSEEVRNVTRRMLHRGVKRLPVVERGVLVGIVSRRDVLRVFARPDAEIAADVGRVLASSPGRNVEVSVDEGVVTLTGDVPHAEDVLIVVSSARNVDGVVNVIAQLSPREPDPPDARPPAPSVQEPK